MTLTFGPCGLQDLDCWLENYFKKKQAGWLHSTFPNVEKLTPLASANPASTLNPQSIFISNLPSTFNQLRPCSPRTKTIAALLEWRCSSPYPPSSTTCLAESQVIWRNPTNIRWQLGNLQSTFLIYSKMVFWWCSVVSFRCDGILPFFSI